MTTAIDVINAARSQMGYVETPHNITKFWTELDPGLQGNPWCAAFVSWVFRHAGAPLPAMGKPYGYCYTPAAVAYAKANGMWDESGRYAPGDIVSFGKGTHTGIIASDDGATMLVYEGNTSPDNSTGSQVNGGAVHLRHRPHNDWVDGVIKTGRWLRSAPTQHPSRGTERKPLLPTVAAWQQVLAFAPERRDGHWGVDCDQRSQWMVTAAARKTGTLAGSADSTIRTIQRVIGATDDGHFGPDSRDKMTAWIRRAQVILRVLPSGLWGAPTQRAYEIFRTANHR